MADEEPKVTPDKGTPEPTGNALKTLKKDYNDATPKERLKKFKIDPVTKTLRRA